VADRHIDLRDVVLAVLVLAVAGLAFHAFREGPCADDTAVFGSASRASSGEAGPAGEGRLTGRGILERLEALEARFGALERRGAAPADAPRSGGLALQSEEVWDVEDVRQLRSGLRQVRQVEQEEREALRWRVLVDRLAPPAATDLDRERAAGRLTQYMRDVRALYPAPGGPPPTPEARSARAARTEALRSQLEKDLGGDLTDDLAAQKLAASMPGGWPPQGAVQPPMRRPSR